MVLATGFETAAKWCGFLRPNGTAFLKSTLHPFGLRRPRHLRGRLDARPGIFRQ
jgi:hypothetical protein